MRRWRRTPLALCAGEHKDRGGSTALRAWSHTRQAEPFMPSCSDIVSVGRLRWIEGTTMSGKQNFAWYRIRYSPPSRPNLSRRLGLQCRGEPAYAPNVVSRIDRQRMDVQVLFGRLSAAGLSRTKRNAAVTQFGRITAKGGGMKMFPEVRTYDRRRTFALIWRSPVHQKPSRSEPCREADLKSHQPRCDPSWSRSCPGSGFPSAGPFVGGNAIVVGDSGCHVRPWRPSHVDAGDGLQRLGPDDRLRGRRSRNWSDLYGRARRGAQPAGGFDRAG